MDHNEVRKLYIDGLNFTGDFGFVSKKWSIARPFKIIEHFIQTAKSSGFELKVFIDAGIETEETMKKWISRREAEVQGEYRDVPQSSNFLMGEIFSSFGVEVYFSPPDADCDDCLATHAQHDGADIMSNDKDFFRYIGRKYKIYNTFEIVQDKLVLYEKPTPKEHQMSSPRKIPKKPQISNVKYPGLTNLFVNHLYQRGSPSPLVKLLGNPHKKLSGLRCTLYHKLGIASEVTERWPEFQHGKVVWHVEKVKPSPKHAEIFECDPNDTYGKLFGGERIPNEVEEWEAYNHQLACKTIIYELYAIWHGRSLMSYMDDIILSETMSNLNIDDYEKPLKSCNNWAKNGECRFGQKCFMKDGHIDCPHHANGKCRRGKNCRLYHRK